MNYSNTTVMHAQKLKIHQKKRLMIGRIVDYKKNIEKKLLERKIGGKKSKIGSALTSFVVCTEDGHKFCLTIS